MGKQTTTATDDDLATVVNEITAGNIVYFFGPRGKRLAILTADEKIRAWRLEPVSLDFIHTHSTGAKRIAFGEDGKTFHLLGRQGRIREWRVDNSGGMYILPRPNASSPLPTDEKIAYVQNARLQSLALADEGARVTLGPVPDGRVDDIRFSPDGQAIYLRIGSESAHESRLYHHDGFHLLDRKWGREDVHPGGKPEQTVALAFHPARNRFAMAQRSGAVRLCDYSSRNSAPTCLSKLPGNTDAEKQDRQWTALVFAGEEKLLGGTSSGRLHVWALDKNTHRDVTVADNLAIEAIRAGLAGGRVRLTLAGGKTELWDLRNGVLRHERNLDDRVVAFSGDGRSMARLTAEGTIWLERLGRRTGPVSRFPIEGKANVGIGTPEHVALSPDGSYLAILLDTGTRSGGGNDSRRIAVYSTESRNRVTSLQGPALATELEFASQRYLNVADSIGESHLMPWRPEELIMLARERYLGEETKPGEGLCKMISEEYLSGEEPKLCDSPSTIDMGARMF